MVIVPPPVNPVPAAKVIVALLTVGNEADVIYPAPLLSWLLFVMPLFTVIVSPERAVEILVPPAISMVSLLLLADAVPPLSAVKFLYIF